MITLVKINPVVVPVVFYDGTNIDDLIDMWGYDNIEGKNGFEIDINFGSTDNGISVPVSSYVLNFLGSPIVLNETQFLGLTQEYFSANEEEEEGHYFFLTRDELIEAYHDYKRIKDEESNK